MLVFGMEKKSKKFFPLQLLLMSLQLLGNSTELETALAVHWLASRMARMATPSEITDGYAYIATHHLWDAQSWNDFVNMFSGLEYVISPIYSKCF